MTPQQIAFLQTLQPVPPDYGGLGAVPRNPDPRDYPFHLLEPAARLLPLELPANFSLLRYIQRPPYNQGAEGSCVPNSTCGGCTVGHSQADGSWPAYAAHQLYAELGGTGQNGIDTRLCLQRCVDAGTPKPDGTREKVIKSYVFLDRDPETFPAQVMAAIFSGHPVLIAALLTIPFGWNSGMVLSSGYHQFLGVGFQTDGSGKKWCEVLNSWGDGWPGDAPAGTPPGVGRILFDALVQNGLQAGYCYGAVPTTLTITPPPPPPPPITSALITAQATGAGVPALAAGQVYSLSRSVSVSLTDVKFDQNPPPPPPSQLAVTGYTPNPVQPGQSFMIQGQGFAGGNLTVFWQGQSLAAQRLTDTQIQAVAPSVGSTASAAVTVRVEAATAEGPPLTVTAGDVTPGQLKVTVLARRYTRGIVGVWAYVQEPGSAELDPVLGGTEEVIVPPTVLNPEAGGYVAASVTCRITNGGQSVSLEAHPAQANGTPAVWQVSGAPPAPATVTAFATAPDGRTGSGSTQV